MHVPRHRPEVGLVFHEFDPITPLEDMAAEAMSSRPGVGIGGEERLHATSEIRLRRLEHHVEVVGQDHERVDSPTATPDRPTQLLLEAVAVLVITDDVLAAIAAGHHVVDRARVLDAESSWHDLDGNTPTAAMQAKNQKPGLTPTSRDPDLPTSLV